MKRTGDLRLFLVLATVAIAAGLALVWRFPVFFRSDDFNYLHWVHTHPNPLAAFDAGENIFASYRPLMYLAWWALVKAFALNPVPYQVFVTLTYALAFVAFFLLARRVFSTRVAVLALVAYGAVFFKLGFIVFWFSDLTFTIQMLFWNLALYFLVRGVTEKRFLVAGVACHVLGALAKEPGMLLVPLIFGAYLLAAWRETPRESRMRALQVAAALILVALPLVAIHPTIENRVGVRITDGLSAVTAFAAPRWSYYAGELVGGPGALLLLATLFLGLRAAVSLRWKRGWLREALPLGGALLLTALLRSRPELALGVLLVAAAGAALPGWRLAFPAVWLAVPVLGLMTSNFMTRAYLIEPSFGAALLVAVFLDQLIGAAQRILGRMPVPVARVILAFALAGVLTAGLKVAEMFGPRTEALEIVSAHRLNCRDLLEAALAVDDAASGTLVVVDYADRGIDYVRDILPLPDLPKARLQKTMVSDELVLYLEVAGASDRRVMGLGEFLEAAEPPEALALIMNQAEYEYLDEVPVRVEVLRELERRRERAWLVRLSRAGS